MEIRERERLDLLILGIVARAPHNGHEIQAAMRELTDGLMTVTPQTTFRALHRLARNRLVVAGSDRRYRLTESGSKALAARRRRWRATRDAIDAVLDDAPAPSR